MPSSHPTSIKRARTAGAICLLLVMLGLCLPPLAAREPERVGRARRETDRNLRTAFRAAGALYPPRGVHFRVFKRERLLEVWSRKSDSNGLVRVLTYVFCDTSGVLGPKRRQGDLQIPEGIYRIDRFNPWSQFYLSLGIDYPNASDRLLGERGNPGGDIFIHGECVTIGCIPITTPKIKELYWAAEQARRAGQNRITVHIYPGRMHAAGWDALQKQAGDRQYWRRFKSLTGDTHPRTPAELIRFWESLKRIHDRFEATRTVPRVRIDGRGGYRLETPPHGSASTGNRCQGMPRQ